MKHYFFLALLALSIISIPTAFTSCSDNEDSTISVDDYDEAILGTWEVVESFRNRPYHDSKTGVTTYLPQTDFTNGSTFKFTLHKVYRDCYAYWTGVYEYELWKDKLDIGFGGAILTIQITGDTMIWEGDIDYDKDVRLVLKKTAAFEM